VRERSAQLETVERPAATGDFVVMDFLGTLDGEAFPGGEGRDQMVELGSGRLVPGFEEQLDAATAGDERTVEITFPDDYGAPDLAGRTASFAVTVKEVKAKELPPLDDDLAAEAGFDTLDELREDIRERLAELERQRIDSEFTQTVLDAAVQGAEIELPDALVEARAREVWDQMVHTLSHQGISKEAYLRIAGKEEDEIVEEGKADAAQALRRDAVLAAIVEAEGIAPSDDEVRAAVEQAAGEEGTSPRRLMDRLRSTGRLDQLRADLAQRAAMELLTESATAISVDQAKAREALWTPGSEGEAPAGGRLWTPGS
jgi:trigger factor